VPEALLDRFPVHAEYSATGNLTNAYIAYAGSYLCVVYEDQTSHAITAIVIDADRDSVVKIQTLEGTGRYPRVIGLDGDFIAMWVSTSVDRLRVSKLTVSTLTWSAPANLLTDIQADETSWDTVPDDNGGAFFVVYVNDSGQLDVKRFNNSLSQTHAALNQRSGKSVLNVAIHEEGSRVYVALQNDTDNAIECIGYVSTDLTSGFAVQTIQALAGNPFGSITVGSRTATDAWIVWELAFSVATPPTNQSAIQWKTISSTGTVTATLHETRNCQLASRIFRIDSHSYVTINTAAASPEEYGLCLIELGNSYTASTDYRARPVARWADAELYDPFGFNHLSGIGYDGNLTFWSAFAMKDFEKPGTSRGVSIEYTRMRMGDPRGPGGGITRWQCIESHRGAMIPAGFPHAFDGERAFEAGFSWYPWVQHSSLIAGGSLPLNEEQEYLLCYVYTDAIGRVWRSTPSVSVVLTPTVGGTQTVRLAVPHYTVSSMHDVDVLDLSSKFKNPVGIEVYRRNNTTSANGPFIRILTVVGGGPQLSVQPCDPLSTDFLLITDTGLTDANQPELYTTGGVQEHEVPPPFAFMVAFDGRVLGADRRTVWPSQELVAREGVFWNSENSFRVDEDGDITAFSVQDFSCIVWKRNGIYYFQGSGPDDTGINSAYTTPVRVSTDDGCIEARSVALTPVGTFYQSERGIMLLDRQFNTDYIGAPVEDELAAFPEICAATVVTEESEVRFWCRGVDDAISDFRMLVYDYQRKRWCVRRYFFDGEFSYGGAITALVHRGDYIWARTSGKIFRETDAKFSDFDGATDLYVERDLETADLALDGFAGFQRIWYLTLTGKALYSDILEAPSIVVEVYTDHAAQDSTPIVTYTFLPPVIAAQSARFPLMQLRMGPLPTAAQNSQAIRVRVRELEVPSDTFNEGVAWTSLMLEYGVETGRGRFPATQRA
jgi:hypothetical protein